MEMKLRKVGLDFFLLVLNARDFIHCDALSRTPGLKKSDYSSVFGAVSKDVVAMLVFVSVFVVEVLYFGVSVS